MTTCPAAFKTLLISGLKLSSIFKLASLSPQVRPKTQRGAATAACLGPISPFHYKDEQVIDGLPQQFMDRMVKEKGSTGHMKTLDPYGSGDSLGF